MAAVTDALYRLLIMCKASTVDIIRHGCLALSSYDSAWIGNKIGRIISTRARDQ